jgi:hypothetical protein
LGAASFVKSLLVAGQLCCLRLNQLCFDFNSRAHERFKQYGYALSIIQLSFNPAHHSFKRSVLDGNPATRFQTSRMDSDQAVVFNAILDFADDCVLHRYGELSGTDHAQHAMGVSDRLDRYEWTEPSKKIARKQGFGFHPNAAANGLFPFYPGQENLEIQLSYAGRSHIFLMWLGLNDEPTRFLPKVCVITHALKSLALLASALSRAAVLCS